MISLIVETRLSVAIADLKSLFLLLRVSTYLCLDLEPYLNDLVIR